MIGGILAWLTDPANTAAIGRRLLEHLEYSLLATLIAALQNRGLKKGVASLCIGGGEATAVALELVD